jgi:hypothetical protein
MPWKASSVMEERLRFLAKFHIAQSNGGAALRECMEPVG